MTFCFELGKTRFRAAEESGRGRVQMKLRVSKSEAVHFFEPGKFCFVLRWSIMKALSSHFIMLNAVGKHFIVDEAHTTAVHPAALEAGEFSPQKVKKPGRRLFRNFFS